MISNRTSNPILRIEGLMNATTWRVLVVLPTFFVTGCAVLTVDVDVYKGPLANQRSVLTEQTVAMVMGAKPLLVELRDVLEVTRKNGSEEALRKLRSKPWYRAEYVSTPPGEDLRFEDYRAARVNEILGLYLDKSAEGLEGIIRRLNNDIRSYVDALKILDADPKKEKELWDNEFFPKMVPSDKSLLNGNLEAAVAKPLFEALQASFKTFLTAEPYSTGKKSRVPEWLDAYGKIHTALSGKPDAQDLGFSQPMPPRAGDPYNEVFGALANRDFVLKQARVLFNTQPSGTDEEKELCNKFADRVVRIAASFIECRQALSDALEMALHLIGLIDASDFESIVRPLDRESAVALISKAAISLVSPSRIAKAPQHEIHRKLTEVMKTSFKKSDADVAKILDPQNWDYTKEADADFTARTQADTEIRNALSLLFVRHAPEAARVLLSLHKREMREGVHEKRFGLVRGPSSPEAELKILKDQLRDVSSHLSGMLTKGVLDGGRIPQGIQTLIENYLKARADRKAEPDATGSTELNVLLDALVHFSEKVVFIANNDRLLQLRERSWIPGIGELAVKTVLFVLVGTYFWGESGWEHSEEPFVRTLQAVGNSILVQVDDIRHYEVWEKSQGPKRNRELQGLVATLAPWRQMIQKDRTAAIKARDEAQVDLTALEGTRAQVAPEATKDETVAAQKVIDEIKSTLPNGNERLKALLDQVRPSLTDPDKRLNWFNKVKEAVELKKSHAEDLAKSFDSAASSMEGIDAAVKADPKGGDAKAVLDLVLASLKYLHLQATATQGQASPAAKRLQETIKLAHSYRTDMVYIRPSSAYLRTSYPSSSLQQNAKLEWTNTLDAQGTRSLPFFGGLLANKGMDITTAQEIDKQFWQNINRVRVAGSGNTNYVVAKDDIGNWYVKNYSAEPEPIIKAAKGLASFGLGTAMKGNPLTKGLAETTLTTGEASPLEKQYEKRKKEYEEQAKADFDAIKERVDGLKTTIENAWGDNKAQFADLLTEPHKTLTDAYAATAKKEKISDSERVIEVLGAIKRFHNDAVARILAKTLTVPADAKKQEESRQSVKKETTRVVRKLLDEYIAKRKNSVQNYETVLTVLGDTADQ